MALKGSSRRTSMRESAEAESTARENAKLAGWLIAPAANSPVRRISRRLIMEFWCVEFPSKSAIVQQETLLCLSWCEVKKNEAQRDAPH
jgi:hypothetical protein